MARQTGIIQLSGPLGGISFYRHKKYGMLARACNPVSAERIAKDPAFARTRENGTEFGMASRAGKLLRDGLRGFLQDVPTDELDLRVMRLMMHLKTQDTVSKRGERQVGIALALQPELLRGFVVSETCGPDRFLLHAPVVDVAQGTITLPDLRFDHVPKQATHVVVTGFRGRIDFGKGERNFVFSTAVPVVDSPEGISLRDVIAPIGNLPPEGRDGLPLPSRDVVLRLPAPVAAASEGVSPAGQVELWGLKIVFLQEVNGVKYTLKTGAAGILETHAVEVSTETTLHGRHTAIPEARSPRDVIAPIINRPARNKDNETTPHGEAEVPVSDAGELALLGETRDVPERPEPVVRKLTDAKTRGRKHDYQAEDG
jgi:hypothetical protein